jgi:hypothetical protein
MMKVEIVPAQIWHGNIVADKMRQADRDEVFAMSGRTPVQAMDYSLARSDYAMAGLVDGEPICLFGVGSLSLLCSVGVPWLLGTDYVEKHYRVFAKNSKAVLANMSGRYSRLINAVDDRNELSKRWLAWLGFKIGEPKIMGVSKLPFRIFEIEGSKDV